MSHLKANLAEMFGKKYIWNQWVIWKQIWQKCLEKNISETNESFESKFGRNVWKKIYLKPMSHLKANLAEMFGKKYIWNQWVIWKQIWQKCLEKNISETNESFESKFGRNVWKKIYLKPMSHLKANLAEMFGKKYIWNQWVIWKQIWQKCLEKKYIWNQWVIWKQIWQKCLEKNVSETNESFESKFGGNVRRMVLYKMNGYFLCRSEILEDCHPNDILIKHRTLWEN